MVYQEHSKHRSISQILLEIPKVYVVLKNTDQTEGRGFMKLHKIFEHEQDAVDWVRKQPGVFGSEQSHSTMDGVRNWNGYTIVPQMVIPKGLLDRENELKNALQSEEANVDCSKKRADKIRSILE